MVHGRKVGESDIQTFAFSGAGGERLCLVHCGGDNHVAHHFKPRYWKRSNSDSTLRFKKNMFQRGTGEWWIFSNKRRKHGMKYGIWKFVFTDDHFFRWESSYWMKASFQPGWIYIICKSSQVPRWQVRLVPLERDKWEGWRMKEELGFWKIQHRICLGGNANVRNIKQHQLQMITPLTLFFKCFFPLEERLVGVMIIMFVVQFCGVMKMSCKVSFETTNINIFADATGGVSLGYMSEAQVDLEAEGAEESHQSMCWVEIMEIPCSSSPDIRRGGWKMKHRMSCR